GSLPCCSFLEGWMGHMDVYVWCSFIITIMIIVMIGMITIIESRPWLVVWHFHSLHATCSLFPYPHPLHCSPGREDDDDCGMLRLITGSIDHGLAGPLHARHAPHGVERH